MSKVKVIELKKSIFAGNDARADLLRQDLKRERTFLLNLMSSPGAGKTTTLLRLCAELRDELQIAVMEADIDSDVDAKTMTDADIRSVQLHTGGMCHLDADMTRQGLESLGFPRMADSAAIGGSVDTSEKGFNDGAEAMTANSVEQEADVTGGLKGERIDLAILENVGNLVCPAEFDTGAVKNMMILSVPEGDDKPLKYPLMFSVCDLVLINKIDVLSYFDFDLERCKEAIHRRSPNATVIPVSAKTGEGIAEAADWIRREIGVWRKWPVKRIEGSIHR